MRAPPPLFAPGREDWGSSDDEAFSQEDDLDEVAAVKMVSVYDGGDLADHMPQEQGAPDTRRLSFERDLSQVAKAIDRQLRKGIPPRGGAGASSTHGTDRDTVSLGTEHGTASVGGGGGGGDEEADGDDAPVWRAREPVLREVPSTSTSTRAAAAVTPAAAGTGPGARRSEAMPSRGIAMKDWGEDALAAIDFVLAADEQSKRKRLKSGSSAGAKAPKGGAVDVDAFLKERQQARMRGELVQPSPSPATAALPAPRATAPPAGPSPTRRVSPRGTGPRTATQVVALVDPDTPPRPRLRACAAATVSVVPESIDPDRRPPRSSQGASRRVRRSSGAQDRERSHAATLHPQTLNFDEGDLDEPLQGGLDEAADPFDPAPDAADYSQRRRSDEGPTQRARRRSLAVRTPTIGGQSLSQSLGAALARGPAAVAPVLPVKRVEMSQRTRTALLSGREALRDLSPTPLARRMSTAGTQTVQEHAEAASAAAPPPVGGPVAGTPPDAHGPRPSAAVTVATATKRRKSGTTLQDQMRKLMEQDAKRIARPLSAVRPPSPGLSLPSVSVEPSPGAGRHKDYAGSLQTGSVAGSGPVSWAAVPPPPTGGGAQPGEILQRLRAIAQLDKYHKEQVDVRGPRCLANPGDAGKSPIDLVLVRSEAEVHMHKFLCHADDAGGGQQEVILMLPSKRKEAMGLQQGCRLRIFHPWTEANIAGRRTIVSPLACEVL